MGIHNIIWLQMCRKYLRNKTWLLPKQDLL
jgi:hypothetical protein